MMVKQADGPIVIEVDRSHNNALHFPPLGRSIRGRFEFRRAGPDAARLSMTWPVGEVPSQRLEFDPETGKAAIIEPLADQQNAALRQFIERQGKRVAPAREEVVVRDSAEWLFWLWRSVKSGVAKLVSGRLPESVERPQSLASQSDLERENKTLRDRVANMEGELAAIRSMLAKR